MRRGLSHESIGRWLRRARSTDEIEVKANNRETEYKETKRELVSKQVSMTDFAVETGLMPEEHIVQLLEDRRGELRQQEIITKTGWSRSTVSRLLTRMEQQGQIVRVRLGVENVVYLPNSVPDFARRGEPLSAVTV
ncbi:helix-turn-helix transcriptional regulator [Haladaptatus sp. DFWS20]|uniref:helix-turn-helix transcriptional regulator n=1 Tax=Haladaptatus sp. DFWS20 TaxID=3403467 RepID=UPI003EBC6D70